MTRPPCIVDGKRCVLACDRKTCRVYPEIPLPARFEPRAWWAVRVLTGGWLFFVVAVLVAIWWANR